ncbi:MAG: dihydrofolate reductase family protein [Rubricoccaceae bacterium]|nr:dihydrofolate reductase family protein [Rubricoccaceae bacterium]
MRSTGSEAKTFVFSRSLDQTNHPSVTIVPEVSRETLAHIRAQAAKDIWLFGGGVLLRSFVEAGLVETVEVAKVPALLGAGVPLLAPHAQRARLKLKRHRVYGSRIVFSRHR